jgi:HK97 family phage portal protein
VGRIWNAIIGKEETVVQPQLTTIDTPLLSLNTVGGYGALMSVDYAACEQTKARSLASLPITVVKDGRERVPNHPLVKLLNGMPNEDMTAIDFLNWHRLRCDTFGTAYWRIEWYKNEIQHIYPVTCSVYRDYDRSRPEGRRTVYSLGGDQYTPAGNYFYDEIVAVKTNITKNGTQGVSLAKLAAEEIGLSVDLELFYKSMLKNGNHHFGHVELPPGKINKEQADDLKRAVDAKTGVNNAGKTPIFSQGAKWVTDTMSMKDASLIEQQEWVLDQVCRATNVPPWKVYKTTGTTYSSSQQMNIDYVTDTMIPDVRAIEQAFTPIFEARGESNHALKFNLRGLMRGDDASRSAYYREMVYSGTYTRADVREFEDMNPIEGLEKPLLPLNYGTVEPDGNVTVYSNNTKQPADGNQQKG